LAQVHRLLDLTEVLSVTTNLWHLQNGYFAAALAHHEMLAASSASEQVDEFWRLGDRLSFNLDRLRALAPTPG
jgi:hypothetical protein